MQRCDTLFPNNTVSRKTMRKTLLAAMVAVSGMFAGSAFAAELDVPVMMWADGDLDVCSVGAVRGLDPNGDNFQYF